MSDFIFILPAEWIQISTEIISLIGSDIGVWVDAQDMTSLTDALKAYLAIPLDTSVAEAKFFNGEILAVKLG